MKRSHISTLSVVFVLILSLSSVAQKRAAQKPIPLGPPQTALDVIKPDG